MEPQSIQSLKEPTVLASQLLGALVDSGYFYGTKPEDQSSGCLPFAEAMIQSLGGIKQREAVAIIWQVQSLLGLVSARLSGSATEIEQDDFDDVIEVLVAKYRQYCPSVSHATGEAVLYALRYYQVNQHRYEAIAMGMAEMQLVLGLFARAVWLKRPLVAIVDEVEVYSAAGNLEQRINALPKKPAIFFPPQI